MTKKTKELTVEGVKKYLLNKMNNSYPNDFEKGYLETLSVTQLINEMHDCAYYVGSCQGEPAYPMTKYFKDGA